MWLMLIRTCCLVSQPANPDCISYMTNDEVILSYAESALDFAASHNAPILSLSWSTHLTHIDMNAIQLADRTYAEFLQKIDAKGRLNNTILFVMGDHGLRYGKIRTTLNGYYEDKMPNMWIYLPPTLRQRYPDWKAALDINSRFGSRRF